ncbi:MAG: methionyl-tRNA formyltransferase [Candidatus Jorgensenbacteria bacterium]|nr:methionyl-tRNA formyltransferase [Candidatus Jorgensenbacteria bacterium]
MIKYAFFGTPEFASIVLEKLISAGLPPAAVVCNPDRPVGRKKIVTPPPAKQSILDQDENIREQISIYQPEKVKEIESVLRDGNFDLFVIAAYGKIISKAILEIPKFGTVGVHPSLLPKLRGSSPIQSSILFGEKETGVSLFMVDEFVDNGPIISKEFLECDMNSITYTNLHDSLANLGAEMLVDLIPRIGVEKIELTHQDDAQVTFTKKFITEDGFVDENSLNDAVSDKNAELSIIIDRKIRALNPEPGVYTILNGERTKLLESELRGGKLILKKIQIAGKTPQNV